MVSKGFRMAKIYMISRYLWNWHDDVGGTEYEKTCQRAMRALFAKGYKRESISIDYTTHTGATNARETAKRFVTAYGLTGARFMKDGYLDKPECPPAPTERVPARFRKRIVICPHCEKPIRHARKVSQADLKD